MRIFIFGSKEIGQLSPAIIEHLDGFCCKEAELLIGDCYGIDLAVQTHLRKRDYKNVTVFTACETPRNNVGNWAWKAIPTASTGFSAHRQKDKAMVDACDSAFAVWNAQSKGTQENLQDLHEARKPVILLDKFGNPIAFSID